MLPVHRRKNVAKSRPVRCFFGTDLWNTRYNSSSGGTTYTGLLYPQYHKRLKEDECLLLYKASYSSPLCNQFTGYQDIMGVEEMNGVAGNRKGMNNCTHRKIGTVNLPHMYMYADYRSSTGRYYYMDYYRRATTRGYAAYLGLQLDALVKATPVGHDKMFSARAFWSMRPKFVGDVSLLNSIFELKDFKDVVNISKLTRNLKSVASSNLFSSYKREFNKLARDRNILATLEEKGLKSYGDLTPATLGVLARDTTGSAATAVLTMNLAIKPTIADVLGITAQLATSAMDAQNTFHEYGEKGSTSHFSEVTRRNSLTIGTGNNYLYSEGSHYTIKQTATMRSFYQYKLRSLNETLVRYWGLAGTMEVLWNMLPLSFVLDYVFTIGKALQYMDRDNNVEVYHTEYCESVKIICNDGLSIIQDQRVPTLVIDGKYKRPTTKVTPHLISGTNCTRYTRKVMEPYKGPALPKFKLPSTSQAVNVLALARCFIN